jgi:HK97 family phage major capsid protein
VPAAPRERGLAFGAMLRVLAAAGGNAFIARQIAEAEGAGGLFANQNTQTAAAGGVLVPEAVAGDVIELLRPLSVVTAMGPQVVPMPNGNMTMNRLAGGATFAYEGEQQDLNATGVTFGQARLSAKKLGGIIPISNDLLRQAGTAVDRLIRDTALADAAQAQDRFFLRGPGTEFSPRGLRFQAVGTAAESTAILAANATVNLANVTNDLGRAELALANANVSVIGAQWVMAPRVAMYLRNVRDANGNPAFPEMATGQLRGKRVWETTELPTNLGGGFNESEVLLVQPQHVLVGEHLGIQIAMSTEAAYRDTGAVLQSAFSRDETLMRMIMMHDIALRHLSTVSVLTGVLWAP